MKQFFKKWAHALLGLYAFIYLPCFTYLEAHIVHESDYTLIHSPIDDAIPFCEYFIVPYLFWFIFIAIAVIWFFFKSQSECIKVGLYLIVGMSIAVAIFFLFPNGLGDNFRPNPLPRDNIFSDLVKFLYGKDTSTNVFPSLHVYNTLCVVVAVYESKTFGKAHTAMKIIVTVIGILICASTVFLKQHSIIDVWGGFALAIILYPIFYRIKFFKNLRERCVS